MELTVAIVGASVIMLALTSTMFIAMRATDTSDSPTANRVTAHEALSDMLSDMQFAICFTEQTATAITFYVPDRDGDLAADTIRYAWSGTPGDPLTREYNGGTAVTFVDNVHVFQHDIPIAGANTLSNPGGESLTLNWLPTTGAILVSDSLIVHSGNRSLLTSQLAFLSESGMQQDILGRVFNGTEYRIGAWMRKTNAADPLDVQLQLRIVSSVEGEQIFAAGPFRLNATNYEYFDGSVTPTWTGVLLSATWEAVGISNIQHIYVDDAFMRAAQSNDQTINVSLQVGSNSLGLAHSGAALHNNPLD